MTRAKLLISVLLLVALVEAGPNTEVPAKGGAVEEKAGTETVVKGALRAEASDGGKTEIKNEALAEGSETGQKEVEVKDEPKAEGSEPGQTEAQAEASDGGQKEAEVRNAARAEGSTGGQTTTSSTLEHTQTKTTNLMDLLTYKDSVENGGYPFVHPRGPSPGFRHVRAHDGFHDLRREKMWAHWNDKFTTTLKPMNVT